MADSPYKQVQTFNAPTAYDQQMVEARRRRRMAEALANQAYTPQDVGVAPIPSAAPLVQGLQAFLAARAGRKADEAEEKALETKTRAEREAEQQVAATGSQIAGRLMGGAPMREISAPDGSGLNEVSVESRYRQDPNDAVRLAMTKQGGEAMKGNPMLAAALAQQMDKPKEKKAPATVGGMMFDETSGKFVPIEGYAEQQEQIARAKRPDVVVAGGGGRNEPLVTVRGEDGNPILVPRSQAAGMTPYTPRTAAQEIADVDRQRSIGQKTIDTQTAIDNIDQLLVHPGRISGTGASSFLANIPGTDARGFQAQLETFKAQTFIPMVSALKGMGALSDAEGKKLSAAVGALDPSMPEAEFERELRKVQKTLYEKARAGGLNVVMPSANEGVIDLPPRPR
jgi:hypothetical protein